MTAYYQEFTLTTLICRVPIPCQPHKNKTCHHGQQSQGSDFNSAEKEKVNQDSRSSDSNSAEKEKVNQDGRSSDSNSTEKKRR